MSTTEEIVAALRNVDLTRTHVNELADKIELGLPLDQPVPADAAPEASAVEEPAPEADPAG